MPPPAGAKSRLERTRYGNVRGNCSRLEGVYHEIDSPYRGGWRGDRLVRLRAGRIGRHHRPGRRAGGTFPTDLLGNQVALDAGGDATFAVGGTLTVDPGQVPGIYTGSVTVEVAYN